jgi:hypothetical protein
MLASAIDNHRWVNEAGEKIKINPKSGAKLCHNQRISSVKQEVRDENRAVQEIWPRDAARGQTI